MIKIEKGVPLPKEKKASAYPVREMEIGDSFFIAGASIQGKEQAACRQMAGNRGFKLTIRTVEGGLRVWRVA